VPWVMEWIWLRVLITPRNRVPGTWAWEEIRGQPPLAREGQRLEGCWQDGSLLWHNKGDEVYVGPTSSHHWP
jgi:hypothetical protein